MKTVRYSASGGRVVAAVQVAPKRDGSYELMLWERETNEIVGPGGGPLQAEQLLRIDPSRFRDEELELIRSLWERGVAKDEGEGSE